MCPVMLVGRLMMFPYSGIFYWCVYDDGVYKYLMIFTWEKSILRNLAKEAFVS